MMSLTSLSNCCSEATCQFATIRSVTVYPVQGLVKLPCDRLILAYSESPVGALHLFYSEVFTIEYGSRGV